MSVATLLLREPAASSLASLVEKSQNRKAPFPVYELRLNSCQLDFVRTESECRGKASSADEGFESDVDTVSIVSSDDSFTSGNSQENGKIRETDSANGSASSDSDTETGTIEARTSKKEEGPPTLKTNESYHLVDCMCYTDIKFANVLVFVVKGDALVFRFDKLDNLRNFYTNFSTFKAIANQKAYSKNFGTKFNLLQRTDKNGITHIEITKEPEARLEFAPKCEASNIISLNTPDAEPHHYRNCGSLIIRDDKPKALTFNSASHNSLPFNIHKESRRSSLKDINLRQRSESPNLRKECNTKNSHASKVPAQNSSQRSASSENILDLQSLSISRTPPSTKLEGVLKKVWNSAEDLLETPKRPNRRKIKPKAPPPPENNNNKSKDILKGQYVRVNVTSSDIKPNENSLTRPFLTTARLQNFTQKVLPSKPKEITFQQFKYSEPKRMPSPESNHPWTYSVPRFLKKPRSQSETRTFTPMAYRYIDTTDASMYYGASSGTLGASPHSSNVSNRLFGMSSKLKDFSNTVSGRYETWENRNETRRGSLGELTYKINSTGGSLKSVIKKDDAKRRSNEKKVTFSAYTTVQVV